jgi:hypothetical protein
MAKTSRGCRCHNTFEEDEDTIQVEAEADIDVKEMDEDFLLTCYCK